MIQGKVKPIRTKGNGRGNKTLLDADQQKWLSLNINESKVALAQMLGVSRKCLMSLIEQYNISYYRHETKKQKAVRKTAEKIVSEMERVEAQDIKQKAREKQRAIKKVARELVKSKKNILDRLQETVKGEDGKPLSYNGEELGKGDLLDISLIDMGKDDPQANLYARAQALAVKVKQREEEMVKKSKAILAKLKPALRTRKQKMRKALESYGLWSGMMETTLDQWGDAYMAKEVAKLQWEQMGCPMVETQVTAQAQENGRPSQYFETYQRALKVFNECDQKLSTALSKYQRITGRSEEDNSFLNDMIKGLKEIDK